MALPESAFWHSLQNTPKILSSEITSLQKHCAGFESFIPFLIFPDQVGTRALPNRVVSPEVMQGAPKQFCTSDSLSKRKISTSACSTSYSGALFSLQVIPSSTFFLTSRKVPQFLFIEGCSGCPEKRANFTQEEEVSLKKFSASSQHGTCWLCQQSLEQTPITNST